MSYEKQTWNTGDTITADKLNHMEDGISSSAGGGGSDNFVIHFTADYSNWSAYSQKEEMPCTCDKTFAEIGAEYKTHGTERMIAYINGVRCSFVSCSEDNGECVSLKANTMVALNSSPMELDVDSVAMYENSLSAQRAWYALTYYNGE